MVPGGVIHFSSQFEKSQGKPEVEQVVGRKEPEQGGGILGGLMRPWMDHPRGQSPCDQDSPGAIDRHPEPCSPEAAPHNSVKLTMEINHNSSVKRKKA